MSNNNHSKKKKNLIVNKSVQADADFIAEYSNDLVDTTSTRVVSGLHRSNILRLQTEDLLKQVSLTFVGENNNSTLLTTTNNNASKKWSKRITTHLQNVRQAIEEYCKSTTLQTLQSQLEKNDTTCPFHFGNESNNNACTFTNKINVKSKQRQKQLQLTVNTISSTNLSLTTATGNANVHPHIEAYVRFEAVDFIDEKDYLYNRYFYKRNRLLWQLAKHLCQQDTFNVHWCYHHQDIRRPALIVGSKSDAKATIILHIGPTNTDWLPVTRLWPNRNNLGQQIKGKISKQSSTQSTTSSQQQQQYNSSPAYNYALALDHVHLDQDLQLDPTDYPHATNACRLVKIWCLQRGLWQFDATIATCWIVYLYRSKLVSPKLGPLPVLTALLKLWSETNWLGEQANQTTAVTAVANPDKIRTAPSEGYAASYYQLSNGKRRDVLVIPKSGQTAAQTIANSTVAQKYAEIHASEKDSSVPTSLIDLYATQYTLAPVLLDPTLTINVIACWSPVFVKSLQLEAKRSLQYWHSITGNGTSLFRHLFLLSARFWDCCDVYIEVPLQDVKNNVDWGENKQDLGHYECLTRGAVSLLTKALNDRIVDMRILTVGNKRVRTLVSKENNTNNVADTLFASKLEKDVKTQHHSHNTMISPLKSDRLVIGLSLDSNNSLRLVDRGPPVDQTDLVEAFKLLWGKKVDLRRFKDGAIVHAVVWDESSDQDIDKTLTKFANADKMQGGIVEQIVRWILQSHILKEDREPSAFILRDVLHCVDSLQQAGNSSKTPDTMLFNPISAHRTLNRVFDSLSTFLKKNSLPTQPLPISASNQSLLGLPLAIDGVEPISTSLRFADLFPPMPHPLLGGPSVSGISKVSGAIQYSPIEIQIRFGASSNWPTDLKAIHAAKAAMLIQLVKGINKIKAIGANNANAFKGTPIVTVEYAEIIYQGYLFRIFVRADPEMKLLQNLTVPNPEAIDLFEGLYERHVIASIHHSMVNAVYVSHPSSSAVVRLLQRWMACHLFSDLIPVSVLELIVVYVYTNKSLPVKAPGSVVAGFMHCLHLIATYYWSSEPLIVDPTQQLTEQELSDIQSDFDKLKAKSDNKENVLSMFIVGPLDNPAEKKGFCNTWIPRSEIRNVEWVVLSRVIALAQRSYDFLYSLMSTSSKEMEGYWNSIFCETDVAFRSFSALLRVDQDFAIDSLSSSSMSDTTLQRESITSLIDSGDSMYTKSMRQRYLGPADLQIKTYRNLTSDKQQVLLHWQPVNQLVQKIKERLAPWIVVFYNHLCPQVIGLLWRPKQPRAFSAASSEYSRPTRNSDWKVDTMITVNYHDIMREIQQIAQDVVIDYKLLDSGSNNESSSNLLKRKAKSKVDLNRDSRQKR